MLGYKGGRICVPNYEEIKKQILYEAHNTPYAMQPSTTKMYRDLKKHFFVAKDEERCDEICGKVFNLLTSKS